MMAKLRQNMYPKPLYLKSCVLTDYWKKYLQKNICNIYVIHEHHENTNISIYKSKPDIEALFMAV